MGYTNKVPASGDIVGERYRWSHQSDDAGDDNRVAEGHAQHRDRQRPEADGVLQQVGHA